MGFLEVARARYSVRAYEKRAVEQEKVDAVLEAGRLAPSACNRHPSRVIVATSEADLEKMARSAPNFAKDGSVFGAPLVLLVCVRPADAWRRSYDGMVSADIDATIVCDQMMMAAHDAGLGTCWVCHFDPDVVRREFDLPEEVVPVNMLTVGYAADEPRPADKREARRIPLAQFLDVRA